MNNFWRDVVENKMYGIIRNALVIFNQKLNFELFWIVAFLYKIKINEYSSQNVKNSYQIYL